MSESESPEASGIEESTEPAVAEEPAEPSTRLNDGDGLQIAHPEDFGITRDEDGEVNPVKQRIPGTDKAVRVRPMVGGAYEAWEDVIDDDEADNDRVDQFLRKFIAEGIGSDGLDAVPDFLVPGLVQAVKNSSGHEVFRAVEEQQLEEQMAAIQQMGGMGDGMMENFMEKAMDRQLGQGNDEEADATDETTTSAT